MRKIFLLSFDDGVIWDQWFIEMLNHYGVPCTFNLNSGLEDFVWHYGPHPIRRLRLAENKHIYDGHEIASHTLHHTWLDAQTDEQLNWEVGEDVRRLKLIFGKEKLGFAVHGPELTEEYDLIANRMIKEGHTPVKKIAQQEQGVTAQFKELQRQGEALLAAIAHNKGGTNKDLQGFAAELEALIKKWRR